MKRVLILAAIAALANSTSSFAQEFVEAGSELALGEAAVVPHLVPNGPQVPIELTVTAIEEGTMDDLQGFEIPPELAEARPIYVRYAYENVSEEDLSNQIVGAFLAVDDRDQAHAPALAMSGGGSSFTACRSDAARDLTPGETYEGCLLFMLHEDGNIDSVGYKGGYRHETGADTQAQFPIYYDPVLWSADESAEAPASGSGQIIVR